MCMSSRIKANSRLRNRVGELCKEKGIKPYHLSQRIGKAQSTVSEIINQVHNPSDDVLVALCDELGCKIEDILYIVPAA